MMRVDTLPARENNGLLPHAMDLLRFTTAGSVDDGKSTLIGRLLYDSKGIYDDQLVSIQKAGVNRSSGPIDFSLLTDGLRAEREQGITIDVAYRHFSTPRRRFIIADTPGHEQYTRNMATGASTADLAIILVDATKGLLSQSRRHTYIAALLGIPNVVVAVNKMDLCGYSQEVFEGIAADFQQLAAQLGIDNVYAIPISALQGDNVVYLSRRMSWFDGVSLLEYLETVPLRTKDSLQCVRFPIQYVIRPDSTFRGFAGQVVAGTLGRGDSVIALPSGMKTRVKRIVSFDGDLSGAAAQNAITVTLEDEIDLGRGDLLASEAFPPQASTAMQAKLVWFHSAPCAPGKFYLLKHTTSMVRARVTQIFYSVDVNTLQHLAASTLHMNEIGTVRIETTLPLFFDPYLVNRTMGSFILIDPHTYATVAGGMIEQSVEIDHRSAKSSTGGVRLHERISRNGYRPAALWIVGHRSLAEELERVLFEKGWQVQLVSRAEFTAEELKSAVTILQRTGGITIFELPEEDHDLKNRIATIYGAESIFDQGRLSDNNTVTSVLKWLSSPLKTAMPN